MESKVRNSNIELFRILSMICIIAHHYVVNSGLTKMMNESPLSVNSIFLTFFGGGGKIGINCFVLITGYYMCTSDISLKKFLKLFLEVEFYKIIIYSIFVVTGYIDFTVTGCIKYIFPITGIRTGFTFSYLAFYLLIPFVNKLIHNITKKEHISLLGILLFVYSVMPSLKMVTFSLDYVIWFIIIYLVASYIRLYPAPIYENKGFWTLAMGGTVMLSYLSELVGLWIGVTKDNPSLRYFFVADSNKVLALIVAVSAFMFFKNLNLKYCKYINVAAASCFGILMIHANSDAMRQWLWGDLLRNTEQFDSKYLVLHAIGAVIGIFGICMLIDIIRVKLLEKPFFRLYDRYIVKEQVNAKEENR